MEAGESEYSRLSKTRNLWIFRHAQNAQSYKITPTGTYLGVFFRSPFLSERSRSSVIDQLAIGRRM